MPSYKEMHELARNPVKVRTLARRLLVTQEDRTDWEHDFLESLAAHYGPEALSTRQCEKLIELRDGAEHVYTTFEGFSVATLIEGCILARLDMDYDDDINFIEGLKGARSIKRRQLGSLLRCCRRFGVIED
jgi:hypothetical protein